MLQVCSGLGKYNTQFPGWYHLLESIAAQTIMAPKLSGLDLFFITARVSTTQNASVVCCDILITACLCITLGRARNGLKRTDSVLNRLMVYALQRGGLTSFMALLSIVLFFAPLPFAFIVPEFLTGQLYVASVISMLLAREKLRDMLNTSNVMVSLDLISNPRASE
ncbi:hypothetical protein HGRIS_003107 [Hohenbuehelia grisea]|uniref:DUF6534 domain-containing protein n=1 Tax=Hohenbuehelia grisea TaxID=104357 RepID=A0ABR3JNC6_9AGAR